VHAETSVGVKAMGQEMDEGSRNFYCRHRIWGPPISLQFANRCLSTRE